MWLVLKGNSAKYIFLGLGASKGGGGGGVGGGWGGGFKKKIERDKLPSVPGV